MPQNELERLRRENHALRLARLNQLGDDLCHLDGAAVADLQAGKRQIPPWPEFRLSCERFHGQSAGTAGVLEGCRTIAQLEAEIQRLRDALQRIADLKVERFAIDSAVEQILRLCVLNARETLEVL